MWNLPTNEREYIIHSDINGKILGPISREHAHLPGVREKLCHHATWGMLYNVSLDAWGVQRKKSGKKDDLTYGYRDISVAGHNTFLETGPMFWEETLQKESHEEIGLNIEFQENQNDLKKYLRTEDRFSVAYIFDTFHYLTDKNNEYIGLGIILSTSSDLEFHDGEVAEFSWMTTAMLTHSIHKGDRISDSLKVAFYKSYDLLQLLRSS